MLGGIELQRGATGDNAGEGAVHDVAENHLAGLRALEQCAVVGFIALHMPTGRQIVTGLRSGTEINVYVSEVDYGGAVKLPTGGDNEVRGKDDFFPRAGAGGRWRVLIDAYGEVDKLKT